MSQEEDPFYHLKWDSEYRYIQFRDFCIETVNSMNWNNNVTFQPDITIEEAEDMCFHGRDAGRLGAFQVMPSTRDYYQWLRFWRFLRACQIYLETSSDEE